VNLREFHKGNDSRMNEGTGFSRRLMDDTLT